jgi:hypothetical protein
MRWLSSTRPNNSNRRDSEHALCPGGLRVWHCIFTHVTSMASASHATTNAQMTQEGRTKIEVAIHSLGALGSGNTDGSTVCLNVGVQPG